MFFVCVSNERVCQLGSILRVISDGVTRGLASQKEQKQKRRNDWNESSNESIRFDDNEAFATLS
jgi:hypothetical protein